jgi:hypothetical protein
MAPEWPQYGLPFPRARIPRITAALPAITAADACAPLRHRTFSAHQTPAASAVVSVSGQAKGALAAQTLVPRIPRLPHALVFTVKQQPGRLPLPSHASSRPFCLLLLGLFCLLAPDSSPLPPSFSSLEHPLLFLRVVSQQVRLEKCHEALGIVIRALDRRHLVPVLIQF